MRIGEILRKIADIADQEEAGAQTEQPALVQAEPEVQQPEPGVNAQVTVTRTAGEIDGECCDDETATMVSPLQQEHELLKKSQGVDNNVSEFAGDDAGYDDELASMKQMAGIGDEQQGPHNYAEDLKPVEINPKKNAAMAFAKGRTDRSA